MTKNNSFPKIGEVIASLAGLLALANPAAALTFSSAVGTYNIPDADAAGVTVPILVSGQGSITSFDSVTISGFTHTAYIDLRAILSNGTTDVQLFACFRGGTTCPDPDDITFANQNADLNGTYTFASSGANWYTQTSNPIPAATTYASLQSLSAFDGGSLNNTWTLNIQDRIGFDIGAFTQWSFTVNTTPVPFEFSPALGLGVLGGAWLVRKALQKKSQKV